MRGRLTTPLTSWTYVSHFNHSFIPVSVGAREYRIKQLQQEFGYDRDNAAKFLEYQTMQGQQVIFNLAVGSFAAYKANPFQNAAAANYVLFRKTWMKLPVRMAFFGAAYYCAAQMQTRVFPKLHLNYWKDGGQRNGNIYLNNQDLISKFRVFDNSSAAADAKTDIQSYLDIYTAGPLTKAEMLNRFK